VRGLTLALLAFLGLASGLSAAADGFYDLTVWGPITVGILALALGLVLADPARPRLVPALAVGGLTALWAWSWLSRTWAESADNALVSAGRWALYAAMLAAMLLLMRTRRDRWVPVSFAAAGVVAIALYVLLHMLLGGGEDLFFGRRLQDPLGYVNGQAGYFLLGFWPCVAVAEQARNKVLAGVAAGAAVVLASLMFVSETRGVLPGVVVSAAIMLLVVPGRPRRVWVLLAVGIGVAAISRPLLDVYQHLPTTPGADTDPQLVKDAARAIVVAALVVAAAWTAARFLFGRLAAIGTGVRTGLRWADGVLAVVALVAALVSLTVAIGHPIRRIHQQYDDFVALRVQNTSQTRFLSGGGHRYDYWRIAWHEFKAEPWRGLGAGNYTRRYFLERRTDEDIRQPHSLPLQVLSELGVVGGLALLAFVGAVLAGLWRIARRGRQLLGLRMVAVAAGGAFVAWLMHTSVDWLHIIPGVTGVALCAAAALLAPWSRRPPERRLGPWRVVAVLVAAVAIIAAADSVGRIAAADKYRIDGRDKLRSDPVEALKLANRSLALNDQSLPAVVVKAAAYARLGDYRDARAALLDGIRLEPHNAVTWALLGDLAVRRGHFRAARRAYRRASTLDPRNDLLRSLAKDPRSALTGR
jgi:O-Antigen ligase